MGKKLLCFVLALVFTLGLGVTAHADKIKIKPASASHTSIQITPDYIELGQ
jgi:hypothetical protein